MKQRCDFARKYGQYQALDDETKAEVNREMIAKENEILEQQRRAILADWRQHYPNQFGQHGSSLANPPIRIEVDTRPNSPAPPVNPSPKMRPVARMKSLLDRVAKRPEVHPWGLRCWHALHWYLHLLLHLLLATLLLFRGEVVHSLCTGRQDLPLLLVLHPLWGWRELLHLPLVARESLFRWAPGLETDLEVKTLVLIIHKKVSNF